MLGVAAYVLDEAEAVEPRHVDVGDDDVCRLLAEDLKASHSILRLQDVEACILQRQQQHLAHGARVVDCENRLAHHTTPCPASS